MKICSAICPWTLSVPRNSQFRATLLENCSLLLTENVRGQMSWHIFAPNDGYCLYSLIAQNLTMSLRQTRSAVLMVRLRPVDPSRVQRPTTPRALGFNHRATPGRGRNESEHDIDDSP